MITEDTAKIGGKYRVIAMPVGLTTDAWGRPIYLVGSVGTCKWANYRGACLKFPDNSAYVITFDCLEGAEEIKKKTFREIPTADNVIFCQYRYRFAQMPDGAGIKLLGRLGQLCQILWADGTGACGVVFEDNDSATICLSRLEDIGT